MVKGYESNQTQDPTSHLAPLHIIPDLAEGTCTAAVQSYSRPSVAHVVVLDLKTATVSCPCEHFEFSLASFNGIHTYGTQLEKDYLYLEEKKWGVSVFRKRNGICAHVYKVLMALKPTEVWKILEQVNEAHSIYWQKTRDLATGKMEG